ncbi:hypothetical protein TNCV_1899941 [Trichonephila clavipes]|nr:hypothetical protein TNCV_1899941 [Trichonephila clavipes]
MQKIDSGHMLDDYKGCKRSLKCLFGLGNLGKIQKYPSAHSHRQNSGVSLWGGNWTSKLVAAIGIAYMVPHEKVIPALGEYTRSAKVKNTNAQPH